MSGKILNNIETMRHSLSHVLAAAVLEMFPEAKLGIGPAIEVGFYYDFDLPKALAPGDLKAIEKKMREIINKNLPFEKSENDIKLALKQFSSQPYKIELIKELSDQGEKKVSAYKLNGLTDLCKGPHVGSTGDLKNVAWKLDKIAGAYWRGSEKNKMLQRIYGLAFDDKEELEKYEKLLIEAEKRDHKRLGQELDLFSFQPEAPGEPFWHPKGKIIWDILEAVGKGIRKKYGYQEIKTPLLAKNSLWITSGHWDHYKESMFSFKVDNEIYCIKPMDCPFNIKIYQTRTRSYKELPIRYTEIGHVYRKEKSGELNGLLRVQEVTQDDSHIFLREGQITDEIGKLIEMVNEFYVKLGLSPQYYLSTRPDDFMGEIKSWDKAEEDLRSALEANRIEYGVKERDGAFYGPKIDVNAHDALGRAWQVATIQLDFQLPERFGCKYVNEKGKEETPMMIHAAIFGSFERMIGILTEHFGGAFPTWLAPVQAIVLPISSDKHLKYANSVAEKLKDKGIRVEVDERNESIGKKIREAELQKIPYMLIVGDKEIDPPAGGKKVSVRKYGEGDRGQVGLSKLFDEINKAE